MDTIDPAVLSVARARNVDPLTTLAIVYGTDKYGYHDYTPNYFRILQHLRDRPLRFLEIGVGGYGDEDRGGESLPVWRDFFPQAQVTGIDIQKKTLHLGPRVAVMQGSQVDADFLARLEAERGPFDVIVDDGSHRNEHVVESFRLLFPGLVPGGIYLVEDVQTAFFPRFGGSLELTEPNSVGHFARAMAQLGGARDAIFADVVSVERFHNMIALHKSRPGAPLPTVENSVHLLRACEGIGDRAMRVALVGGAALPDRLAGRRVEVLHPHWDADWGRGDLGDLDLIVARLDAPERGAEDNLRRWLGALRTDGGVLVVNAADPVRDLAFDSPAIAFTWHRFVEVDHREMRVHFPDAVVDPLAREIHTIERLPDAILFVRAPNDWTSNFGYDPTNPQAAEALAHMRALLAESDVEGGLVELLQIETRFGTAEAARAVEERLTALQSTARRYFEHVTARAIRERDHGRAGALFARALDHFPADARFMAGMVRCLAAARQYDEALRVLGQGLARSPGDRVLNVLAAQIHVARGDIEAALPYAREGAARTPGALRPARQVYYTRLLRRVEKWDEASRYLTRALDHSPGNEELAAELALVEAREQGR